jgi:hypothetical protein
MVAYKVVKSSPKKLLCLTPFMTEDNSNNSRGGYTLDWLMTKGLMRCWFLLKSVWFSFCNLYNVLIRMLIECHGNNDHKLIKTQIVREHIISCHNLQNTSYQCPNMDAWSCHEEIKTERCKISLQKTTSISNVLNFW